MSITSYIVPSLKKLSWLALALSLGLAIAFASGRFSANLLNTIPEPNREVVAQAPEKRSAIESEVVTVTRNGFQPAEISRADGKFILMIDNRSGGDLDFRFSRENGESLHHVKTSRQELDWNELMDLRPGRYVLSEANHPDWTCVIRITPR